MIINLNIVEGQPELASGQIWLTTNQLYWFKILDADLQPRTPTSEFSYICELSYLYVPGLSADAGVVIDPLYWRPHPPLTFKRRLTTDIWRCSTTNIVAGCSLSTLVFCAV